MAELNNLARPYAQAAFEHALSKQELQIWSQQLKHLSLIIQDAAMTELLHNPKVSKEKLLAMLVTLLDEKTLPRGFKNFLRLLVDKQRLAAAPAIFKLFEEDCANQAKTIRVTVESVLPLETAEREELSKALQKKFSKNVELHCTLNPNLIGGLIIRAGDTVMDGSVRGQLDKMRLQLREV